jgi:hypothetical protein
LADHAAFSGVGCALGAISVEGTRSPFLHYGESLLKGAEHGLGFGAPFECIFAEQLGEGCRDRAVIADEMAIVPREPEKGAHDTHRSRHWPLEHDPHLLIVHGHPCLGNDMAEVGN